MRQRRRSSHTRAGAIERDQLIMAGLGVVIVGCLVLVLWIAFGGGGGGKTSHENVYHLKCDKCGQEFTRKKEDLPKGFFSDAEGGAVTGLDCPNPSCGAEKSCYLTVKCPNCGKRYTPRRLLEGAAWDGTEECPYCHVDPQKWAQEHRGK